MRKAFFPLLLAMVLILAGCGSAPVTESIPESSVSDAAQPQLQGTVPPDGSLQDVTCKGTYQGAADSAVVATLGGYSLTNRELQIWYWAEVSRYLQEEHEISPDFSQPLDTQSCSLDPSFRSWQQYFLNRALTAWHNVHALLEHSVQVGLPLEKAYQPNQPYHDKYLTDKPAKKFLYGQNAYAPNTMHQAYLDALPEYLGKLAADLGYESTETMAQAIFGTTGEALLSYADRYNRAYFYFTNLTYHLDEDPEALSLYLEENREAYSDGRVVDIRHILLIPEKDAPAPTEPTVSTNPSNPTEPTVPPDPWDLCELRAEQLLSQWYNTTARTGYTFAEYAQKYSRDLGTALDGGAYHGIQRGQLITELEGWCFDEGRQPGDTAIIRSSMGIHILYFCESRAIAQHNGQADFLRQCQEALMHQIRETYPAKFHYEKMLLGTGTALVSSQDLLYPDVAHERFPEIPLYLQQDYPNTPYGYVMLATHGCGITTMSMLASYMADDELTPPEMCARYGHYASEEGTNSKLFVNEPSSMGFYLRESTGNADKAYAALEEGQIVISLQRVGYWTRGGHYIALEKLSEDGRIQVRDSNLYNYSLLKAHKEDLHTWGNITQNNASYWIFEDKVTRIPACSRCGAEGTPEGCILTDSYQCHKCLSAVTRRTAFQNAVLQ